jgi:glycosyltransferase involved in cell wall biosynthesis
MKVLYVNHTGQVSGGEKSLLEVLRGASPLVTPIVACPDGRLADAVSEMGVQRVAIPDVDCSLKLHPRHTTVALARIMRGAIAVRSLAKRLDVSVIHANSIRAGLLATLAADPDGPATVVHLRDRLPASRVSTLTLKAIARADLMIANSRYTAASLDEAGIMSTRRVIGNPVDLERFNPDLIDRYAAREALGIGDSDFVTTVLAQITPWKGQEEAIRAIAKVRHRHPRVRLLLAGSAKFVSKATRYDNRTYLQGLHHLVEEFDLHEHVRFVGERDDVPGLLRATDALLIPSWEEPFGRSMIEAMAMRVPVIATTVGGPSEVINERLDGLLVAPRKPEAWASAIGGLIESPALQARLARNGQLRARTFGVAAHVEELHSAYVHVVGRRESHAPARDLIPAPAVNGAATVAVAAAGVLPEVPAVAASVLPDMPAAPAIPAV